MGLKAPDAGLMTARPRRIFSGVCWQFLFFERELPTVFNLKMGKSTKFIQKIQLEEGISC